MKINGCKIVLLDFFQENKEIIANELDTEELKFFLESLSDLTIIFSDIKKTEELKQYLKTLTIPDDHLNALLPFFDGAFQSSFSWGFEEKEFVFIRLEESTNLLQPSNLKGFQGLIIHEVLHGVQRQRGLEIRLRDSLDFTVEFFTQLADVIPPEKYKREEIITFLKEISQVALFSLKDIFVNVELIKRGLVEPLIAFYRSDIGIDEKFDITPPHYETEFDKGTIRIKDLKAFANAITYTLALIPVWLPFMVLETDSKHYSTSRELKHFIFNKYYINPSFITREMWHIENIFLTSFSFSKRFHRKWYGAIFNLTLEYLLGEDFVYYHLFKASELVEVLYQGSENEERRNLALIPILKAAYVYKEEQLTGIQENNIAVLKEKLSEYQVNDEEIKELEESYNDPEEPDMTFEKVFENLIKLSIMVISRDLRLDIFSEENTYFKDYSRAILSLLQAINYLGEKCDDGYYHTVRLAIKRLLRTDNMLKKKRFVLLLENFAQNTIFQSDLEPTPQEIDELIYNYDFFEIPLNNLFIGLGISFIQNIKNVMQKVPIDDPEFAFLTAQFVNMYIGNINLPPEEEEYLNLSYVSCLISMKEIPFNMTQAMLTAFLNAKAPQE
ncbi:MAG: hypothetical protein ACTSQH_00195 [Candidatus Hodarchaeales archaeon]